MKERCDWYLDAIVNLIERRNSLVSCRGVGIVKKKDLTSFIVELVQL